MSEKTDFFKQLRDRYAYGVQFDAADRKDAEEDLRFANGEQWDEKVKRARHKQRRPVLTEDRLTPSINQVVNDGRQNKPSILAVPMDGGNPETAQYFEGRIRHIEYECDADQAYDTARRQQVTSARGWIRVTTKYAPGKKKGKKKLIDIAIEAIANQFSVIWDPDARRYDKQDARWLFVVRVMSREAYTAEFGETHAIRQFDAGAENPAPGWFGLGADGKSVMVADYYVRETDEAGDDAVTIYATNGAETLDETEWIGSTIPVIPVWGEEYVDADGTRRTRSLVRGAKDPQRLVNLYVSNIAEQISQIPKNPYMIPKGGIAGFEGEWATINEVQRAVVQYNIADANGRPLPPPTRNTAEPPIQALVQGYLQAVDAVKAAMGIFDAALGARSNETSGKAINERKQESDISTFHFPDNEARSRKALGRILLELIPILDGTEPGEKPTRTEDGKVKMTPVNRAYNHPKTGKPTIHDMSAEADYGIGLKTGPSYTSQREAENERIGQLIQAVPDLMWITGDLYFRTSDTPGSEMIADRMERAIAMRTPGLIDAGDDAQKQIGQMKAQLAQLSQHNQLLTGQVHKLSGIVESKAAENASRERVAQMELTSKERMAALQSWTTIRAAEIKAKLEQGIADADREGERLEGMFDRAHDAGLAAMQHAQAIEQAQQQQAGDQQMQAQDQAHQAQMQQSQQDAAADMQDAAAQQQRQQQADAQQQQDLPKAA